MLKQLLLVGLGGGAGSLLRFLTSMLTAKMGYLVFPLATFIVNTVGCLLIGLFIAWSFKHGAWNDNLKALLISGFCGGFTTFSTFSLENIQLYQTGHYGVLALYIVTSILVGLAAVWIGLQMGRSL